MDVKKVKENLDHYLKAVRSQFPNYEEREEQILMMRLILNGLYKGKHLLVEAGTGTGKSLAYILSLLAVMKASKEKRRTVISTYTITLQQQLVEKDFPTLQQMIDEEFSVAIAKGRGNYLCMQRFKSVLSSVRGVFESTDDALNFRQLIKEVYDGEDIKKGDLAEIELKVSPTVWQEVNSSQETCLEENCPYEFKCPFRQARRKLQKADFIVSNHALFFVDLQIRGNTEAEEGLLPPYHYVVFDEAHHLEDAAASAFSVVLSQAQLQQPAAWLQNVLKRDVVRTALQERGYALNTVGGLNQQYFVTVNQFMQKLELLKGQANSRRVSPAELESVENPLDTLFKELSQVVDRLAQASDLDEQTAAELSKLAERWRSVQSDVDFVLNARGEEYVYWLEKRLELTAYAVPLNISEMLAEKVFSCDVPVICTSATLALPTMQFMASRLGVTEYYSKVIPSPFLYQEQARLIVPEDALVPNYKEIDAYQNYISEIILKVHHALNGGIFVLFTSYKMMDAVYDLAVDALKSEDCLVVRQGDGARSAILNQFKENEHAVLFGTSSFWEGVDVKGDALRCVIITKLPFPVPDEPLAEARMERLQAKGQNPFMHYMLPQAILHFKQGFGRLIRSKQDRGMVVVTDGRIIAKRYGQQFLASLPDVPLIREIVDIK